MGSSVSLQQLGGSKRPSGGGPLQPRSRSLSRQGSDDGASVDSALSAAAFGGRPSTTHPPTVALAIARHQASSQTGHQQQAHSSATAAATAGPGSAAGGSSSSASPAIAPAPATPTAAEEAGGAMTWARRLARSAGMLGSGSAGATGSNPKTDGHPATAAGGMAAPAVAAPLTPRTAEMPHASAGVLPSASAAARSCELASWPSPSAAPVVSAPGGTWAATPAAAAAAAADLQDSAPQQPAVSPGQSPWPRPFAATSLGAIAARDAAPSPSPSSQHEQLICAGCVAAQAELAAHLHGAAALHERMAALERQVCIFCICHVSSNMLVLGLCTPRFLRVSCSDPHKNVHCMPCNRTKAPRSQL